ncbi:hypothetical protein M9H77_12878 [Catharanthus roseus]|uniref:Uncharacterized protein n=1 Tax=Catharanthus roseus TaxID=4058 RepID=A0ACC0BIK3_CATRO|nr:hypothetical protein M9H77_12878 [Catharanthus roseus]
MPSQRVAKVEIMKLSAIEEFSKVNELPQVTIEVEESVVLHVKEEISNEDSCDNMNEKSIEKEKCNELKEKERVEEKERLVEKLYIFDFISIISKESEHFECSKEKESELEKSERVKENECFIEKQESEKEEQREKEIVILEERIEDKGRNMEKELGNFLKDFPMISLVELELFLDSYLSHVSVIGDTYAISFGGGLFLVVSSTSNGEPSCFGSDLVHADSFFDAKAGGFLEFNCALFVIFY